MAEETTREEGAGEPGPGGKGALARGAEFAGHRIEDVIGRGGMGVVYRALHLALERERALKVIAPGLSADAKFRERFRRESRLAASIEHPNVIPVHHAGEDGDKLYLTMRLVRGSDLRRLVGDRGPLQPERVARLIKQIAAGLDAAHSHGLVHRDVKPQNVLVEEVDGEERVFLTDFGISRTTGAGGTVTSAGEFLGSPDYVAPEQIEGGPVDGRADVYALGCLVHFALTGKPPFERDNDLAKLFAHANAPRPRPSQVAAGIPPAVDNVVERAMAKRPDDRYATAAELAAGLERAIAGGVPEGPPTAPTPAKTGEGAAELSGAAEAPTRRMRARGPGSPALLAGGLVLAAAAVAAAVVLTSGGDEDGGGGPAAPGPQPRAVSTIDVGDGPNGLTVGEINVWVASVDAGALYAIDPGTDQLARGAVQVGGRPVSVAVGFGSIWAVARENDSILRLDPGEQGAVPMIIQVGEAPSDVAVDERSVWVTNEGSDTVSRVDPVSNQVTGTVPVGSQPRSIAAGGGAIWVANIAGKSVSRIDPVEAATVGKPIPVGQRPNDLAFGLGAVWVTDVFNGTVTRIDPDSGRTGKPIEVGANPRGVKVGFGYVWVANAEDGTVSRVDPETLEEVGEPIDVGEDPADIAVGRGAVWTADSADATVTRIDPRPR